MHFCTQDQIGPTRAGRAKYSLENVSPSSLYIAFETNIRAFSVELICPKTCLRNQGHHNASRCFAFS
jgi:hypothetical protein